jgi:hypothetical protein
MSGRRCLLIIALLLVASGAWLFSRFRPTSEAPIKASLLYEREIDIGMVEPGQPHSLSIPIHNKTAQTITLSDFWSSCGCLGLAKTDGKYQVPLEKTEHLAPGDTLTIQARLDVSGSADQRFFHTISFTSNGDNSSKHFVTIRGKAIIRVFAAPATLVATIPPSGSGGGLLVHLVDARDPARRGPFEVVSDFPGIELQELSPRADAPPEVYVPAGARLYRAVFRLKPTDTPVRRCTITVRAAGGEVLCVVPVTLNADVPVELRPASVVFLQSKAGQSVRVEINGRKPVSTCAIVDVPGWLTARLEGTVLILTLNAADSKVDSVLQGAVSLAIQLRTENVSLKLPVFVVPD